MSGFRRYARLVASALALTVVCAVPAAASCTFTLRLANEGRYQVRVPLATVEVRARVDTAPAISVWGAWRSVQSGGWIETATHRQIAPSAELGDSYVAELPCAMARQWRGTYRCLAGSHQGQNFATGIAESPIRLTGSTVRIHVGYQC